VSIESNVSSNEAPFDLVFDELAELWSLGYRSFKYVNQRRHPKVELPDPPLEGRFVDHTFTVDVSGAFGAESPGPWQSVAAALARAQVIRLDHNVGGYGGKYRHLLPSRAYGKFRQAVLHNPTGWYDLHARHGSVAPRESDPR
jgi:hypothetical protein